MDHLNKILDNIPQSQRCTLVKKWQQILGELCLMALAIPGAREMFSELQHALTSRPDNHHIRLSKGVHNALDDFQLLVADLEQRLTQLYKLVP